MNRISKLVLLAVLAAIAPGCGGDEPPDARPVYEHIRESLRDRDYGAVYDVLAAHERERREAMVVSMRADMARREGDEKLTAKFSEMARGLGVTVEELSGLTSREMFVRGTAAKASAGLRDWAESELDGNPVIEGDRCRLNLRLPRNRTGTIFLVLEDAEWRLVLR